jgi:hypothetical protein
MKMWIDCEWNEFGGELISMALVTKNSGEWYEVLPCEKPGAWVAQHVIPILGKSPITKVDAQRNLRAWLAKFDSCEIVADWPEDVARFCDFLIIGPGMRIDTPPLSFSIFRIDAPSEVPHNALHDARGIMRAMNPSEWTGLGDK